jgi:pimeloyl-ACP methyl ester carboxylesterase
MRTIPLLICGLLAMAAPGTSPAQPKKNDTPMPPDEATLELARHRTAKLREAIAALPARTPEYVRTDVEIYLKAAEWVVRHGEWVHKDSGKWLLATLDQGLKRAADATTGKAPWREPAGKTVSFAHRSRVDGSVQPYAVTFPADYGKGPRKLWRLDVVLHGRDGTICETKFLFQHTGKAAPPDDDFVRLDIYGRGNNAYRWAGEVDVFEAINDFLDVEASLGRKLIDPRRHVLRGFSMGGAGTWHLGLRHPGSWAAIAPGAGFTTTHGYVKSLPNPLPSDQEPLLRIYDALDYAENAANVPVVAYSGAKDPQKAAADNIEKRLKELKIDTMTHLVAPGLEHSFPAEWQKKVEAELHEYAGPGKGRAGWPERVRFVTYALDSPGCDWVRVDELEKSYSEARVEAVNKDGAVSVTTKNVRKLTVEAPLGYKSLTIDGQKVPIRGERFEGWTVGGTYARNPRNRNQWTPADVGGPRKNTWSHGPIDDAFKGPFLCVKGTGESFSELTKASAEAQLDRFVREWDKWMRGKLAVKSDKDITLDDLKEYNLILFGDPGSNTQIAKVLPNLPLTWDREQLVLGGQKYDAAKYLPLLIYPNPLNRRRYVVLNSGHTFHEAEFKGTNALLYPHLGDYAVVRPMPTAKDPAAFEVMKGGIFTDDWKIADE